MAILWWDLLVSDVYHGGVCSSTYKVGSWERVQIQKAGSDVRAPPEKWGLGVLGTGKTRERGIKKWYYEKSISNWCWTKGGYWKLSYQLPVLCFIKRGVLGTGTIGKREGVRTKRWSLLRNIRVLDIYMSATLWMCSIIYKIVSSFLCK